MPQVVDFDEYGYFDVQTEEDVYLATGFAGGYINALTGQEVTLVGQAINAARDTLIGIFGRQGYPTRRGGGSAPNNPQYPVPPQPTASPGGLSRQGFQVNWWAAALGGVIIGAFLLGKRK